MDDEKKDISTSTLARPLPPEDIRPEMFVTVLNVISEHLPFLLCADEIAARPPETYRVKWVPRAEPQPLRVLDVCLPFVLVSQPDDTLRTLDVRRYRLALLTDNFGRKAFDLLHARAKDKEKQERKESERSSERTTKE